MRILLCLPHTHPASWEFDTLTPFQSFVASLVEWGGAVGTWVVVTVPHSLLALGQRAQDSPAGNFWQPSTLFVPLLGLTSPEQFRNPWQSLTFLSFVCAGTKHLSRVFSARQSPANRNRPRSLRRAAGCCQDVRKEHVGDHLC